MKIQLAIIVPALQFGLLMAPVFLCPAQNPFTALEDAAKEKAAEAALTKVLNDNLPLKLDAKDVYPTVTTLPGGPFSPKPLQLTADQLDQPLPPGDYTINTLDFCSEYSVHQPGAGVAYVLGPYEGKAAGAIGALIWRGTEQYGIAPQSLQAVSWAIQSGLTYNQMPKSYQAIVDQVIPDLKNQITGDFVANLESTYNDLAKTAKLPPLDTILAKLGAPGRLALDAERQRQILTSQNTSDELKQQTLFQGQESGVYTPVKAETGPWTERIKGQVYMKLLIAGGNMASNNVMQIRVMPPPATTAENSPRGPHLVRAKYDPGQAAAAESDGFVASITNIMEGLLGYAQGQGAQALGQVAALVKAVLGATPAPPAQATLGNPCGLSQDVISKYENQAAEGICACMPSRWNFCSNAPTTPTQLWTAQKNSGKALGLSLPEAQIYTDYCIGNKVDGIMFVPQPCPDGSMMRALQFVKRTCADITDTSCQSANKIHTTCGDRTLGEWNLDECPGEKYLIPDTCTAPNGDCIPNGPHVISDEPTANAPLPSGWPYLLQFYDVLMCGTQVMDAFQWTRTGLPKSQAQFCTVPCPAGQSSCAEVKETMAGKYSDLNRVNLDPTMGGNPPDFAKAVCKLENASNFVDDPLLKAVQTYEGCGHTP
jgi:hypothetical protein